MRKTPLKKIGPVTKKWIEARGQWIKDHPPDHAGYYMCYLCDKAVHIDDMKLDHIKARTRRPDLRFVASNFAPTHEVCNGEKGSRDVSQL